MSKDIFVLSHSVGSPNGSIERSYERLERVVARHFQRAVEVSQRPAVPVTDFSPLHPQFYGSVGDSPNLLPGCPLRPAGQIAP